MRLIDADAFIEKLAHVPMIQEAIKKAMDSMPTVEAIPIEWIKDYANELISLEESNYFAYRGIGDYGKGLLELIEKWRENGKKAMRDEVD